MSPTTEEVAGWLRETADNIEQEIAPLLGRVLSGPYTEKLRERAAQVEAMGWPKTCDTCRWWETNCEVDVQIGSAFDWCNHRDLNIENQGANFGCIHHEEKPQPPVKK